MLSINEQLLSIPLEYTKKITESIKQDKSVINLARGDSEFITPKPITDYLRTIIDEKGNDQDINSPTGQWTHYEKEAGSVHLKTAIIKKYEAEAVNGISTKNILITQGGMNAIFYTLMSILNGGDEVILFDPAYIAYYPIVTFLLSRAKVIRVPLRMENNYGIDYKALNSIVSKRTKAVVFVSPYNPCGRVYSSAEVAELSEFCQKNGIFLIHDENHEREVYDGNIHVPALTFDREMKYTISLNSMSRLGMGGWRIGWMIANERIIKAASSVHAYVNMTCNTFVQECAAYALENEALMNFDELFNEYREKRDILFRAIQDIDGFSCNLPEGTCYLFPDISVFYENNKTAMERYVFSHPWFLGKSPEEQAEETQRVRRSKSYTIYLFLLLKCRVGVLPGLCYGPDSDEHIRFSFSVKREAILEAVRRLNSLNI